MDEHKYVLFGAGEYALKAIELLGSEKILYILDNDAKKQGQSVQGIPVCLPQDKADDFGKYDIIISTSQPYQKAISEQLLRMDVKRFRPFQEVIAERLREKIMRRTDYVAVYRKAIEWIRHNVVNGHAIICNTDKLLGYPEVTGYYIPTLLRWGYRDLALSFIKWLCGIQKVDGSWYDTDDAAPYVFDTAQILKGLLAIRELYPEADNHIIRGCDWILSNVQEDGRLTTPTTKAWGNGRACSELIHLYCLSPLAEAAEVFHRPQYKEAAERILLYYKKNHYDEIMHFGLLSHFYAYVMEGLLDMGEEAMVREAMDKVAQLQRDNGAVPAYNDVDWICSTGLFQFSLVWFRLGDIDRGNRAFTYACKLQNESGGWYGSYLSEDNPYEKNDYFPGSEISWVVKFFLDALYYKNLAEFNLQADTFLEQISEEDQRYQIIRDEVQSVSFCPRGGGSCIRVADIGCGKGRYLKNLLKDEPENAYYGVDLSEAVLTHITDGRIVKKQGSLTNIGYPDQFFDLVYTCEAMEHAVDIESAVREMARVTSPGGKIVIVDKNQEELGRLEIGEWETWFDAGEVKALLAKHCAEVRVIQEVAYENKKADGLFLAWVGTLPRKDTERQMETKV